MEDQYGFICHCHTLDREQRAPPNVSGPDLVLILICISLPVHRLPPTLVRPFADVSLFAGYGVPL
jgi:hypothetical protein